MGEHAVDMHQHAFDFDGFPFQLGDVLADALQVAQLFRSQGLQAADQMCLTHAQAATP